MPTRISPRRSFVTNGAPQNVQSRLATYDIGNQFRKKPSSKGQLGGSRPRGNGEGDQTTRVLNTGDFEIAVYDANGSPITLTLASDSSSNLAFKTGTAAPTVADYPDDGDNGQFYDTAASQLYIVRNYQGTLIYPNFVSISGTISDTQHGDRSTTTTTMHKFSQISGSITATQHGALTSTTASHQNATTSDAGFMSSADKTKLDNAVSTATASRLVIRDASAGAAFAALTMTIGDASTEYRVSGTRVVDSRKTGWSNWTGTSDRTSHASYTAATISNPPTQAEVQAIADATQDVSRAMRALIADLHSGAGHGLIGT